MFGHLVTRTIRRYIKATPSIYIKIAKNLEDEAVHATLDTDLVIEGFQRSGNTYCWFLVKEIVQKRAKIAHHTHSVSSLKLAKRFKLPTIVIIRAPLDSLVSATIYRTGGINSKHIHRHVKYMIDDYYSFYNFLRQDLGRDNLLIYDFQALIKEPDSFCRVLHKKFEKDIQFRNLDNIDVSDVQLKHSNYEAKKQSQLHMSTQNNEWKNSIKPEFSEFITKNYNNKLRELEVLYTELKDECIS